MDPCPSCDSEFPDFDGDECKCGYRRRRSKRRAPVPKQGALTSQRVDELFAQCLHRGGKDGTPVRLQGIKERVVLHAGRLKARRKEIAALLAQMPDQFRAEQNGGGGGWSLLSGHLDRHGNHWAEHATIERLFLLGMGIGKVEYFMPRKAWHALPGGMPYYVIKE